ncbi:DMT family transporter [Avibacterium sp. 21-595]|uniref:DMT family transporter n=1 Tax=Avibacterium sp. 21-595 TaxID=2911527 RepID=UPI00202730D9|nr:DMT family transporter [Avibacterium sp. 21-595]URL06017.1 DMT family transporter [Avibacterium sp. 21-595]
MLNNRYFIAFIYVLAIGLAFPIIRYVSLSFHILNNNAVRLLSAGVIFVAIVLWKYRQQLVLIAQQPKLVGYLILIAVIMVLNIYLSTEGIKYTTALTGSIFGIIMMPVATIMAAIFYQDERNHLASRTFYIGSIIALIGSFAFVLLGQHQGESSNLTTGIILLTGWIIVQPLQNLVVKKAALVLHPIVISASTAILSGIIYLCLAIDDGVIIQLAETSATMLIILILAGIYCLMAGMFLAFYIVQQQGLVFFNILQLLVPISTAIISFILLGETVNMTQVIAMLLVMSGCFIALRK